MINVNGLVFEYPGQRALDDVAFTIRANSVTALVGPNGAGKTTLMRCVCGLEKPLSGAVTVDGIDVIAEPRLSHERLGYLSDFFGLYDALSVRQVLMHAASANGSRRNLPAAAATTATRLGLSDRLEQRVGELSRGLRQRVAIGQAIIHEPKVLILDEPASGLDPEARHDLAELFRTLQKDGMTLLVSSHILAELGAYATDMLVIRGGRIIEQRTLKDAAPLTREIVMELADTDDAINAVFDAFDNVSNIRCDGRRIRCALNGDDDAQHRLLRALIEADIAVVSFATLERDLQQSYLESMQAP